MSDLITQDWLSLTPAYGRDYKTAKEAVADFKAGKDFIAHGHRGQGYVNISDFAIHVTVNIRYNRIQRVAVYTTKAKDRKDKAS